ASPFRKLLQDCLELYRHCAEEYAQKHPDLIRDSPGAFVERMLELHRGLVLKIYTEMVQAKQHMTEADLRLGQELFEHAWGKKLNEQQVRDALIHYVETTYL